MAFLSLSSFTRGTDAVAELRAKVIIDTKQLCEWKPRREREEEFFRRVGSCFFIHKAFACKVMKSFYINLIVVLN